MKNRVIVFILILILTCNVLIPKKVNATVVGTEVAIEVGTVLYYIIQGVITGVEVKTIVETISTGGERYTVYRKTNGSSTLYKFVNGNNYRIRPQVAQALVDGLTDKQLVEMANNVTINEEGMMTSGDISDDTKKVVNGIMIDIGGSVPLYENYYTDLVERRNILSSEQLDSVNSILKQFAYSNTTIYKGNEYQYPYFAIVPQLDLGGIKSYSIYFSTEPLVVFNKMGSLVDVLPVSVALKTQYAIGSSSCTVRSLSSSNSNYPYTYYYEDFFESRNFETYPVNEFLLSDISVIGHGIINLDENTYNSAIGKGIYDFSKMIIPMDNVYEIPYSLADVNKPYTYINKNKMEIVIKDGAVPVTGNIDTVVEQINDYENTDKENHVTWDNIDSAINKNLIVGVIDEYYNPGIDIPIDTPTDLSGVNKRLDEVIEKLGAILGSIGDINALTDEQLKEILKDLDLTNVDGLTIEQVREYADEREQAQEKELETELDIDKFKVDNGIINKFPFCIPFDLIKVIKKMDSTATAPRFEFPFKFQRLGINETIVLDLSQFEKVAVVVRWFVLVSYLLLLIYATRSLIKG